MESQIKLDFDLPESPLCIRSNKKIKTLLNASIKLTDSSPKKKKIDPEAYENWYPESKTFMRQGQYIKAFSFLNRHLEKKLPSLTEIQRVKATKLMIHATLNIILKNYLPRLESIRFPMLFQMLLKSDNFLRVYYQNLMVLVNSKEETRKLLLKTPSGKDLNLKKTKKSWKLSEEIQEKEEDSNDTKDEVIQKTNTFMNFNETSEKSLNMLINKGFEVVSPKKIMFLLDEFFVLLLKQILCLGLLEKRKGERDMATKFLSQGFEISKNFETSRNTDILSYCVKIRVVLGNLQAENFNYKEAGYYYEQALNLGSYTMTILSSKTIGKSAGVLAYHIKLEQCLSQLVIILQDMAYLYELQDNFSKCHESAKLSFWIASGFFHPEEDLWKFVSEQYQNFSEKYSNYLRELGDIDRVFSAFVSNNSSLIQKPSAKSTLDESEIIANQTQAFNEQMYYKFQYEKVNDSLFIPIKSSILNQNSSISTNTNLPSRICSAKPKITTFKANDTEMSTTLGPALHKTISECMGPTTANENLTSSLFAIGSPVNGGLITGTKSFINDHEAKENSEDFKRKKKRIMSAKYERNCYLKITDRCSLEEGSSALGLFPKTYKPKQLTTDKYFKTPVYRVKTFQEINDEKTMNSGQEFDHFAQMTSPIVNKSIINQNLEKNREASKKKSEIRPKSAVNKSPQKRKSVLEMEIQDLDDFFSKFIDEKLLKKKQTKTMERVNEEFGEIMKDEDFDRKEFDFSKTMLRLKKKYPLPRFNDEGALPGEHLNRIKEHTEITNQAFNITLASGISSYLQKQKEAQKELEKEQIAQNIYQSTIILQQNNQGEPLPKSPIPEGKNKFQTILLKKNQAFSLKQLQKDLKKPTSDRLESFSKLEIFENSSLLSENKKKQQEKLVQHHKALFLNLVDSYEKELETIDKQLLSASKTTVSREMPPSSSDRSYISIVRAKSFMKPEKLKFVKYNLDLANSTNLLSLKAQAAKLKNVGFGDLVNFKMRGSGIMKTKEKKKEKSPINRKKSRFQVSFDYAQAVENSLL